MNEVMDRHEILASEFHIYLNEDTPILHFMQLSDRANAIREEKRKAAKDGKTYIG
jgi:hypothetical protein